MIDVSYPKGLIDLDITDVVELTGISEEEIHFYEENGLISNNSEKEKEYSQSEIENIKRIKLLRKIYISIYKIKQIQEEKIKLNSVLAEIICDVNADYDNFKDYKVVAKAMMMDNVTYTNMDAQKYLDMVNQIDSTKFCGCVSDITDDSKVRHPWRRYFARQLDFQIYQILWFITLYLIIGIHPIKSNFVNYLSSFVVFILMIFIEPALISKFGTTIGKSIFGLYITDFEGNKPSYSSALSRTWSVFSQGEGCNIPIYNIWRNYKSYKACKEGEDLPWELGFNYTITDTKGYRIVLIIVGFALTTMLSVFIMFNAEMPKNRGNISAEEFAENYNDYISYLDIDNGKNLCSDGTWKEKPFNGTCYIDLQDSETPNFDITETDGTVTRISLEFETTEDGFIDSYSREKCISGISYIYAQKSLNIFNSHIKKFIKLLQNPMDDYSFNFGGVTLTSEVECRGYYSTGDYLYPMENEEHYFYTKFVMEKVH